MHGLNTVQYFGVCVVTAALLAGCGGGGGDDQASTDGTSDATVNVSQQNAIPVVGETFDLMEDAFDVFGVTAQFSNPPALQANTTAVASGPQAAVAPLAEVSIAAPCITGSSSGTWNDADDDDLPSAGDSANLSFTNCNLGQDEPTLNGEITLDFFDPQSQNGADFEFGSSTSFAEFSVNDDGSVATADGDIRFEVSVFGDGSTTVEVASSSLNLTTAEGTNVLSNLSLRGTSSDASGLQTFSVNGTFNSAALNGTVVLETTTPFETDLGDDNPRSGVLRITGAGGSRVQMTAQAASGPEAVFIQIDSDGDGAFETQFATNWEDLETAVGGSE